MESYHYLNQSGVYTVPDVNDAEDFKITLQCMDNIGFTSQEVTQVLDVVVAILLIGNLEFEKFSKPGVGDIAQVAPQSMGLVEKICGYLQVPQEMFVNSLVFKQ